MDLITSNTPFLLAATDALEALKSVWFYAQIFIGFSVIIFVHELGHFAVAKWAGVRVEQFAIGFFREVFGFTYGETRYSFNLLPLGGYVKMLGQEDFEVDKSGELQVKDDPRSFAKKPVGHRMAIVSAGVVMNLLLAAVLFMIVFMAGMEVLANRIGAVLPDSPAAMAGLLPGDKVLKIEGEEINEFREIQMAVSLAPPAMPLEFEIQRDGEIKHLDVEPRVDPRTDMFQIGVTAAQSNTILAVGPEYDHRNPKDPRPGDRIVEVNGRPVTDANANEFMNFLLTNPMDVHELLVERPKDPDDPESPVTRVPVTLDPRLVLLPADSSDRPRHLLGLVPLTKVSYVEPDGRADLAGLEEGDIVLKWGAVANPTAEQIEANIVEHGRFEETDIPVWIERDGRRAMVAVRPKVKVSPVTRKRSHPDVGARFDLFADELLRIGGVVDEVESRPTPAKLADIPANAVITALDGTPVSRWIQMAEYFRKHAGERVTITYDFEDQTDLTCSFPVPPSIRTVLGLGSESRIASVAGQDKATISRKGRSAEVAITYVDGLRAILAEHVGETVPVEFRRNQLARVETGEVHITKDMLEPWVGLLGYTIDVSPGPELKTLRKSNPIEAITLGAKKTYYFVVQVYQVLERMIVSRSLGVEKIQGPVGIIKAGGRQAEAGWVQLFFFLAIISANLAVINFLPLPIVDGGHIVFLVIEKIKGSPLSLRVQVATQVIGLILIFSAFLVVTIQDLFG